MAPAALIKVPRPLITPAGPMISIPLLVITVAVKPVAKVPLTVPVADESNVTLSLLDDNDNVIPVPTVNVLLIVIMFPAVPAARVQFPLMVRLFNVIVGTAVMFVEAAPIITSSLVAGTPDGFQFEAVVHTPPVVGDHVFVAACVKDDRIKMTRTRVITLAEARDIFGLFFRHCGDLRLYPVGNTEPAGRCSDPEEIPEFVIFFKQSERGRVFISVIFLFFSTEENCIFLWFMQYCGRFRYIFTGPNFFRLRNESTLNNNVKRMVFASGLFRSTGIIYEASIAAIFILTPTPAVKYLRLPLF